MIVLGNKKLLEGKLAVILNSSQSKTPCGNDPWIISTTKAVAHLVGLDFTIISSLDLLPWELVTSLVSINDGNQVIVSPRLDDNNGKSIFAKAVDQFDLDAERTAMVFIKPDEKSRSQKANWIRRDRAAVNLAHLLMPISIRKGGKMAELIESQGSNETIDSAYRIKYEKSLIKPPRYKKTDLKPLNIKWDYVTHWTRTRHGPWPGEKIISYHRRLLESNHECPNNAFNTLLNIAREETIRASSNRIRGEREVIGFTELEPSETLKQMRWLPKRVNWNFEPYGVAIRRDAASRIGMRPVIYGNADDYMPLPDSDKPYFQSRGQRDVDWSMEREWRHPGDLKLDLIPDDNIKFLVWRKNEVEQLRSITASEILVLSRN